jgi:hypothetical protein
MVAHCLFTLIVHGRMEGGWRGVYRMRKAKHDEVHWQKRHLQASVLLGDSAMNNDQVGPRLPCESVSPCGEARVELVEAATTGHDPHRSG